MSIIKQKLPKMNNDIYYRPPWTCGKYNAEKHVAIMFNLLTNSDFFFEAESAAVVNLILKAGRNKQIAITDISKTLDIAPKSVSSFCSLLVDNGLLINTPPSIEKIDSYRKYSKQYRDKDLHIGKNYDTYSKEGIDNAFMAYTKVAKGSSKIFDVMFELTYRCNEKCIHCYNPGATRNDNERSERGKLTELTLNDYKRIIDELCENGLTTAGITGGDPFCHKYVWEIIDYLYQKDIATTILTNGLQLCGQEERLASYFPNKVQLSLYSGDPKIHDAITRNKGSWKKTISVLEKLNNLSVPIDIACPIIQNNLKSYHSVKPYMKKYGSYRGFDIMITDASDGDKSPTRHSRLNKEQMEIVLTDADVMQYVSQEIIERIEGSRFFMRDGAPCGAITNTYCINPNGDLTPCITFHHVLGNLSNNGFREIIDNSDYVQNWEHIKSSQYEDCYTHDYCDFCIFCPGNNYSEHGNPLKAGENNCFVAKTRYSLAMKMKNGIDILHGKTTEEYLKDIEVESHKLKKEFK